MTPAINQLKSKKIIYQLHEYQHVASCSTYGLEAVEKLAVDPARVFKTLVVQLDSDRLAVAILPVVQKLSMKLMAKATGVKKVTMADSSKVEKSTGYVLGGVSPIGQKKSLITVIDHSASSFATVFVSAGRRGLEIELSPADLMLLTRGRIEHLCVE
ncbi:MAG: ybaK/ebsC protein [Osedax symbiont Rs1]|nr:MAG: ybaK/ebsC protein [Osedax symbiont Rs1]